MDASELIDRYCEVWNEPDPSRRAEILASVWTSSATYTDPSVHAASADELLGYIAAVRARRPGAACSARAPSTLTTVSLGSRGTSCWRTEPHFPRGSTSRSSRPTDYASSGSSGSSGRCSADMSVPVNAWQSCPSPH